MEILIKVAQMILILSIIVVLHEGGHYAAAKYFKTKVERFFLFFDVKFALFKTKIGETVYGIGWLPLGGYVKIAGMIDESMDTEQMKKPAQPWEFRAKPAWQRLIIMLGGIIVNLLLAMVIFTVLSYTNGQSYISVDKIQNGIVIGEAQEAMGLQKGDLPVGVNGVMYNSLNEIGKRALIDGGNLDVKRNGEIVQIPITEEALVAMLEQKGSFLLPVVAIYADSVSMGAKEGGLQKGDKLVKINSKDISNWFVVVDNIKKNAGRLVSLQVERNGEAKNLLIPVSQDSIAGISPRMDMSSVLETQEFGLGASIVRGVKLTFATITDQVQSFKVLYRLKGKATKYMAGPIGLVKQMAPTWDWTYFWSFTALLSAWLAFVNLLPIPGLDGGHAMFTLYEMLTGHKPGDKFMEIMQIIGFVFLMGLMVFIFGNDIFNLIF